MALSDRSALGWLNEVVGLDTKPILSPLYSHLQMAWAGLSEAEACPGVGVGVLKRVYMWHLCMASGQDGPNGEG